MRLSREFSAPEIPLMALAIPALIDLRGRIPFGELPGLRILIDREFRRTHGTDADDCCDCSFHNEVPLNLSKIGRTERTTGGRFVPRDSG